MPEYKFKPTDKNINEAVRKALLAKYMIKGLEETHYMSDLALAKLAVASDLLGEATELLTNTEGLDIMSSALSPVDDASDLPF